MWIRRIRGRALVYNFTLKFKSYKVKSLVNWISIREFVMARKVFPAVIGEVQFVQGECKYINNTIYNWGKYYFYGQK